MKLDILNSIVQSKINECISNSEILSLGELLEKLKHQNQGNRVVFDFGGFSPTGLDSYRGYYNHLAFSFDEVPYDEMPTVGGVLELARSALGNTFEGYKGGQYLMTKGTPIWVANYGRCHDTALIGVSGNDYRTIFHTAFCEL